ncbi:MULTISPECIES: hypothetical protein [Salinibaculum]|uniref:hypothetical protein n=1 Tax=Salinibaculum TaxID=2732368 RepID=UPI0030CB4618
METLAVIESAPGAIAGAIEAAALSDGATETGREMFVRVTEDSVETPASGTGARRASYCTLDPGRFDDLVVPSEGAVEAMFDVDDVLGWLSWVDSDRVTVRFEGDAGIATRLTLAGGTDEVSVACVDDPTVLNNIETFLPTRFDGATFLDEDGTAMPTTVETTVAQLDRLVRAVDLADDGDRYPLHVRDDGVAVDVETERASVSAPLRADVAGPAVTNRYDESFAEVVQGLDGDVTLQTGPGEPVAFVQDRDTCTLRFVVTHA